MRDLFPSLLLLDVDNVDVLGRFGLRRKLLVVVDWRNHSHGLDAIDDHFRGSLTVDAVSLVVADDRGILGRLFVSIVTCRTLHYRRVLRQD